MSKKHYVQFAGVFARQLAEHHENHDCAGSRAVCTVITELCRVMRDDNPRFSASTFLDACFAELPAEVADHYRQTT
jgi:hypothetical protein